MFAIARPLDRYQGRTAAGATAALLALIRIWQARLTGLAPADVAGRRTA